MKIASVCHSSKLLQPTISSCDKRNIHLFPGFPDIIDKIKSNSNGSEDIIICNFLDYDFLFFIMYSKLVTSHVQKSLASHSLC